MTLDLNEIKQRMRKSYCAQPINSTEVSLAKEDWKQVKTDLAELISEVTRLREAVKEQSE